MTINKKIIQLRRRILNDPNNLYISFGGINISDSTNPIYVSIHNRIEFIFNNIHKMVYDKILTDNEISNIISEINTEMDILAILCDSKFLYEIDNAIMSHIDKYISFCEKYELYEVACNLNKILIHFR